MTPGIAFRDINFKDVKGKLYPIVGLKKKDDHIWANFGQVPFKFDIDGYMKVCSFNFTVAVFLISPDSRRVNNCSCCLHIQVNSVVINNLSASCGNGACRSLARSDL